MESKKVNKEVESKGKVKNFNKSKVTLKPAPYYDREKTDKGVRDDFGDNMGDLKQMNKNLKSELGNKTPYEKLDLNLGK